MSDAPHPAREPAEAPRDGVSRRRLLELGGGLLAGAAIGGAGTAAAGGGSPLGAGRAGAPRLPFDTAAAQQGITTPQPRHAALIALDLAPELRGSFGCSELAALLRDWSQAARRLTAGEALQQTLGPVAGLGAPPDTGEAAGLDPAGLTVTIGFGPGVFAAERALVPAAARPAPLIELPRFAGDTLQAEWSSGDLLVIAAADDAQVALHAARNLARIARGAASLRWLQRGFLPAASKAGEVPRNLMGFHDGTSQPDHRDRAVAARHLWAGSESPAWMRGGGTYLVARRIRMLLEGWDRLPVSDQEEIIGRRKGDGALPDETEHAGEEYPVIDAPPTGETGAVPRRSHVLLARGAAAAGQRLLRRPYSYADGIDPDTAQIDAGLLFLAFQRSIADGFVPVQRLLAGSDAMNDYVRHIGSATFAIPPASRNARDWVGRTLFG